MKKAGRELEHGHLKKRFSGYFAALLSLCFGGLDAAALTPWVGYDHAGGAPVWSYVSLRCADGPQRDGLWTLASGETMTARLLSHAFAAPPQLSFWLAGQSHQSANFIRLRRASDDALLLEAPAPANDIAQRHTWDLAAWVGQQVYLELVDGDTGTGWAWLAVAGFDPAIVALPTASAPALPADWTEVREVSIVQVDGVPFRQLGAVHYGVEGVNTEVEMSGVRARALYILGARNTHDQANPAWGTADDFRAFFIGDSAGTLEIRYASGTVDQIPLLFGYSAWWQGPYWGAPAPFTTDPAAMAELDAALCVARAKQVGADPFFLPIALRNEPVHSLAFHDNPAKIGHFNVEGLTLVDVANHDELDAETFPELTAGTIPPALADWLQTHTIASADAYPASRAAAVDALRRKYATLAEDVTIAAIQAVEPDVTAANFDGPDVAFEGSPAALLMTRIFYENSAEMIGRFEPVSGMVHESNENGDNFGGLAGYVPDLGPFYTSAYTRLRGITLLSNMGLHAQANTTIDFFDQWLMYFPNAYPTIQLGGQPVPGHATVIANKPHIYYDELRLVGWPTRYTSRDFGNPENDGHGLLMLSRYRSWLKQGRPAQWVNDRWDALHEAAEYIPWCLDNPDLSFSEHGLLYNETEGGMQHASLYCDLPCWLGLLGYAEMARVADRSAEADRWEQQAERLRSAMEPYYPRQTAEFGEVWDWQKAGDWHGGYSTLAPVCLGIDYYGYDVANRLPTGWADRTRRTYARLRTLSEVPMCAPIGLGYGQGYLTEGALLLDEMADATQAVEWVARLCYAPRLQHPYRAPEGASVGHGGQIWRRWGDLGNLYQMAEMVYVIHVLLGLDDLGLEEVLLMPRMPLDWTAMEIADWPLRAMSGATPVEMTVGYRLTRPAGSQALTLELTTSHPLDAARVRMGPFPLSATGVDVTLNGAAAEVAGLFESGDSQWVWVELGDGSTTTYSIAATPHPSASAEERWDGYR